MAAIDIAGVTVVKNGVRILHDVDLSVRDGELLTIVGRSGSGKTTLLRAVAGLDPIESGGVSVGGVPQSPDVMGRNVAMVFQENVLYPAKDVAQNVAFPLEVRRRPKDEIDRRVLAEGRALHIENLMNRNPAQLAAGQQQLVQIARAMVRVPDVFLMDEPLARLDAAQRIHLRGELKIVQGGYGVTTLYVTNDPVEAMAMADRIAVLDAGRVVQVGSPDDVYHRPADLVVAELLGSMNRLTVRVEAAQEGVWLRHGGFRLRAWAPALTGYIGREVELGVRPEYFDIAGAADSHVAIERVDHHGPYGIGHGTLGGSTVEIRVRDRSMRTGDTVPVRFDRYLVFDPETGTRVET